MLLRPTTIKYLNYGLERAVWKVETIDMTSHLQTDCPRLCQSILQSQLSCEAVSIVYT